MNLLITNDDGINAQGIYHLAKTLKKDNKILVVAPDNERSGSGHGTSIKSAVRYKKVELIESAECYALSGTPTDCVKFGLSYLSKEKIDLIISGINHGRNLGTDVIYSGTVGAATEALIGGYNAVAVSYSGTKDYDFGYAASFVAKNLNTLKRFSDKKRVININFPNCKKSEIKGVKITPLGREMYDDKYIVTQKGSKDEGYILQKLPHIKMENPDNCDIELNLNNYITITPLGLDLTDYKAIDKLNSGELEV